MENQNELKIGIGTEEAVTLKPATIKVLSVKIEQFGVEGKKSDKVICLCKHPSKEEPISISSVKYELKGKLESVGLWVNKDSKGLIRKGSALATLLNFVNATNISELTNKNIETTTDDNGYLVMKCY
jgi:hypothetical protein